VLDVEARGGDTPHTILIFGNSTGRLPSAPFWPSESRKLLGVTRGSVVRVTGVVSSYRDRRQLAVEHMAPVAATAIDWRQLMPSVADFSELWTRIDDHRRQIRRPGISRVAGLFYDDPAFRERYEMCPASIAGHHARLGGLLLHTVEVADIAVAMARLHASTVDPDLVLAGALLHDIGKLESYSSIGAFETTVPGSVIGHVALGALMLARRVALQSPEPCTEEELLPLTHILLSHHGKLEFGAPVPPMTLEAEIVHHADHASARAASMAEALADDDNFTNGAAVSARGIWQLDRRRAWRSVMPADGPTRGSDRTVGEIGSVGGT
jgi:3'-5' exoribonuclease